MNLLITVKRTATAQPGTAFIHHFNHTKRSDPLRRLILAVSILTAGLLTACGGDTAPVATPSPMVIVITAPPIVVTAPPIVITATPVPATALPTNPPVAAVTATYAAALSSILTARAQPPSTKTPDLRPTRTPDLRPTYTPLPTFTPPPTLTPKPVPHLGSTIMLDNWTISVAKFDKRKEIIWSDVGNGFEASGLYWVLWLDAKNTSQTSRALSDDFRWRLTDDQGSMYPEISTSDTYAMGEFANLNGRRPLDVNTTPRTTAHAFLAFDVAADAKSAILHLFPSTYGTDELVTITLHK